MKSRVKMSGPSSQASNLVHREKYRSESESFRESMNRVAAALQDNHEHYMGFRDAIMEMRFLPPGRVQAGAGSLKNVTLFNCFVMNTIHDSFTDGPTHAEMEEYHKRHRFAPLSIMDTAKNAAQTMRMGGGVGYDISTLRPKGDIIRGVQSTTDGPLAFAHIWDAVCRATSSAGNRRGAQMLVLRVDHPDIVDFIHAKQAAQEVPYEYRPLRGFNMSIGITDEFMECLATGKAFPLKFNGQIYREVDPLALWDMIMRGTYDWAEPGVLFIDTINRMNNLWYCEHIAATNPCGEQPLPPYGACLLGSLNLPKYLVKDEDGHYGFSYSQLDQDLPHIIRAMDNVNDRTRFPLFEQQIEAKRKRRMGIGVTGLANCIEAMGHPYGSQGFLKAQSEIMSFIRDQLYMGSALLAREKGSFEMFDAEKYCDGEFIKTLDPEVQKVIRTHGIRNSHLTSIAPTGTISFCADNVSSGVEPVVGYQQERRVIMKEGSVVVGCEDYGVSHLGVHGKRIMEVTAQEHVDVLIAAQKHVDSAVSKTCNVPEEYPYEDFKDLYRRAYEGGAKGCTTYRPNGNYPDVIKSADLADTEPEPEACGFDPKTGQMTGPCAD